MRTLLPLVLIVACDSGPKSKPPPPPPPAPAPVAEPAVDMVVKMQHSACYGSCPVYTVEITKTGAVTFSGEEYVATKQGSRQVPLDIMRGLSALTDAAHFFDLRDKYVSEGCTGVWTDSPTTTITITRAGKTKSIERYHGCDGAPPALDQLAAAIDLAAGTAEWIGAPKR